MKFAHLKAVVGALALSVAMAGTAQAQIVSATSDSAKVQIGTSNVVGGPHTAGKVGIWVPNLPTTPTRLFVDFEGLQGGPNPTANIVTTINNPTGTITDHSQFGRFDFSKVDGYTVYYGEWNQSNNAALGDHTVYFGGTGATSSVPTSGSANYNVYGLSNFKDNGQLSTVGTFTADFANGEVTGKLASASYAVDIGTAYISGSGFNGATAEAFTVSGGVETSVANSGVVTGQFFGATAQALAGIVELSNRQYDTAFGGKQ